MELVNPEPMPEPETILVAVRGYPTSDPDWAVTPSINNAPIDLYVITNRPTGLCIPGWYASLPEDAMEAAERMFDAFSGQGIPSDPTHEQQATLYNALGESAW